MLLPLIAGLGIPDLEIQIDRKYIYINYKTAFRLSGPWNFWIMPVAKIMFVPSIGKGWKEGRDPFCNEIVLGEKHKYRV